MHGYCPERVLHTNLTHLIQITFGITVCTSIGRNDIKFCPLAKHLLDGSWITILHLCPVISYPSRLSSETTKLKISSNSLHHGQIYGHGTSSRPSMSQRNVVLLRLCLILDNTHLSPW
jgi:hypothetical protein